ncbi:hypothetical protein ACFV84_38675 [Kitasatospora sp. NPDC059811]|uniref:hypothetical protein n=1 Tax=Streptomycetaceae TaxID=2062 RepID=UPI0007AF3590|nr:hypothetical protein [Streptomyces sp. MJM8645]
MKILRLLTAPAAVLALTAGTVTAAAAAPARPALNDVVVLGAASNGQTVQVHPGDVVQINLPPYRDSTVTWLSSVPATTAPSVLPQTSGSTDPDNTAHATFNAAAAGTSDITWIWRCAFPDRGSACPPFVYYLRTTIAVS